MDIATEVGVTHGLFYHYFDNRRDILDTVIDEQFAAFVDRVVGDDNEPVTTLAEFTAAVVRTARRLHQFLIDEPGLVRFVVFEAPAIDDRVVGRLNAVFEDLCAMAQQRIERGIKGGFLRDDLPSDIVGQSLMSLMLATGMGATGDDQIGEDLITALADFVRFGLAPE